MSSLSSANVQVERVVVVRMSLLQVCRLLCLTVIVMVSGRKADSNRHATSNIFRKTDTTTTATTGRPPVNDITVSFTVANSSSNSGFSIAPLLLPLPSRLPGGKDGGYKITNDFERNIEVRNGAAYFAITFEKLCRMK